jgi:hypothetical protein
VYPRDVLTLKKDLEAEGIRVEFEDPPDQRVYERLNGVGSELVVPFLVNLVSSATWALVVYLAKTRPEKPVRLRAAKRLETDSQTESEYFEYEGPAGDAERILRAWRDNDDVET